MTEIDDPMQLQSSDIVRVFGQCVRKERLKQGLSRQRLAEIAKIDTDTIKRYELGKVECGRMDVMWYLANALHVPVQTLLPPQENDIKQQLHAAARAIQNLLEIY